MNSIIIYILGAVLLLLSLKILLKPAKLLLKLVANSIIGLILLIVFNFLGSYVGVTIGINLFTILISGLLGLPGIALILVLQFIL